MSGERSGDLLPGAVRTVRRVDLPYGDGVRS
jgi:hypothetical protein